MKPEDTNLTDEERKKTIKEFQELENIRNEKLKNVTVNISCPKCKGVVYI